MDDKNTLEDGECSDSDNGSVRFLCSMPREKTPIEEDGQSSKVIIY